MRATTRGTPSALALRPAMALTALLAAGCTPTLTLGAVCDLDSDCPSPLVCRNDRCRIACATERDCAVGLRCVQSPAGPSCSLPPEETCDGDCPGALECVSNECRSACDGPEDCVGMQCVSGSCVELESGADAGMPVDAPTVPDAPCTDGGVLICGNGAIDRCTTNLSMIAPVLTGSANGEVTLLPPHVYDTAEWGFVSSFDAPLPPEVSLGLSSTGFGVVAHIEGEMRLLRLHRFDLEDLSPGPELLAPNVTESFSATAGEDGNSVRLFVIRSPAIVDVDSGYEITVDATNPIAADLNIRPSNPPNVTRARLGYLGGTRSIPVGMDQPRRHLVPETLDPSHVNGDAPVIGSVIGNDIGSYRSSLTSALTRSPDDYVHVAGSAGTVALLHAGGIRLGIWDVLESPIVVDNATERTDALVVFDVPEIAGRPAIERLGESEDDRGYVIAVPVSIGGVGATQFYETTCPTLGPCAPPVLAGSLQSRTDHPPVLARLARVPGGYALGTLEPRAEADVYDLHVRFVQPDADWAELSPNEHLDPLISDVTRSGWVTRDFELRAVSDGTVVTLVVAALERNVGARRDRVTTVGLRACIAR